jgi:hypothetical protein
MADPAYKNIPVDEIMQWSDRRESILKHRYSPLKARLDEEIAQFKNLMLECSPSEVTDFLKTLSTDHSIASKMVSMYEVESVRKEMRWSRNEGKLLSECLLPSQLIVALQRATPPITTLGQLAQLRPADILSIENVNRNDLQALHEALIHNGSYGIITDQDC